jgi:hypothetical protein
MKKESVELTKLLNEIIKEVGDLKNIPTFSYELTDNGGVFYFEYEHQKCKCVVEFTKMPKDINKTFILPPVVDPTGKQIVSMGYSVEGTDEQYLKADYSLLLKVLKTVVAVFNNYVRNYPEDSIFIIMATSKLGSGFNDPQKMKLYRLIAQQNLPTGYRMGEGSFLENNLIFITKK